MNSQDIRNLQEAYMEVVENQQLDELSVNKMLAYVKKGEKKRDRLNRKWDQGTATHRERMTVLGSEDGERRASDKVLKKTGKRPYQMNVLDRIRYALTKEEYDLYDIILSHLLDEGYAETPEAAEEIMVNMSEDWRESILTESSHLELEEYVDEALRSREERMARMVTPKKRKEQERTRKGRAILADIQATERALNEPKTPKSNKPTYDTPAAEVRKLKPKQKTDTLAVRAGRVLRDT